MITFEQYCMQQEGWAKVLGPAILGASLLGGSLQGAPAKQPSKDTTSSAVELDKQTLASKFFANKIKPNEGLRLKSYKDVNGRSIGYGHFLNQQNPSELVPIGISKENFGKIYSGAMAITAEQAAKLFNMDFEVKLNEAIKLFPNFSKFKESTQLAILDGIYRGDIGQSPGARKLMNAGNWKEGAAKYLDFAEIKKSDAPKGIVARMNKNAEAFRQETFKPNSSAVAHTPQLASTTSRNKI